MKKKNAKYYIKDGIKCSKRDLKEIKREIRLLRRDVLFGYIELIKLKFKKRG